MSRNYLLLLLMTALVTSFFNWVFRAVPSTQDPSQPVFAKVKFLNQILKNPPDGKPFVVQIFGDPKQIAIDVKFCVEAFPEVESLGIPTYDNTSVETDYVMHVERQRVAVTADCFKIGRLDKDQTLTIRYPAKFKQSPTHSSSILKLRNSGNGYSFDEVLGPRSTLNRNDRRLGTIASSSASLALGSVQTASIGGISITDSKFSGTAASNTAIITSDLSQPGIDLSAHTPVVFSARSGSIFLSGSLPLAYAIYFENVSDATAAQTEVITHPLDSSVLLTFAAISLPSRPQIMTVLVSDASNQISRYSYDQTENLTALSDENEHTIAFSNGDGQITTFAYDAFNLLPTLNLGQGMSVTYTYDNDGNRLSESTMKPYLGVDYSYDGLGKLVKIGRTGKQYPYDGIGRLSSTTISSHTTDVSYDVSLRLVAITAVSSTGAVGQRLSGTFAQGTAQVFLEPGISVVAPAEVTVKSATIPTETFISALRGEDASIYYYGARWLNPSSSRSITADDERLTMVRPLRVRMLDNGGAHLTVTSEVEPAAEYQQRYQEEREPDVPLRPLRVRMLDSGGAHLTVESRVANRRTVRFERQAGGSIQRVARWKALMMMLPSFPNVSPHVK